MKIIDGKNAILGRLAAYVAKESMKGEELAIVNCEQIFITGNKKNIFENYEGKRKRVGSTQKGPKVSRTNEKIVKMTIRGMLPNARRMGRGRDAIKRIKCYTGIPKEFEGKEMTSMERKIVKGIRVKDISK
ncbi:MAG: 50S ribosomal protein L13 [Candidatus Nanoarchaeia archaeon]|nr:50S ribosomal protein L13 [Candidatus Nanoarchaeia archaeon]MDD5358079.1 50S ribosomal protein L13 [Candidatus Nanoarchaeia archaeon]MDD5589267.1 50S ribosomal protein L13 [Candidatus Nanoarchaeia archaeon]